MFFFLGYDKHNIIAEHTVYGGLLGCSHDSLSCRLFCTCKKCKNGRRVPIIIKKMIMYVVVQQQTNNKNNLKNIKKKNVQLQHVITNLEQLLLTI